MVVTFALIAVLPAASVVMLVSGVVPPTASPNVVVPAVFTSKVKPPLTVPASVMLPAAPVPVEARTALPVSATASLYACVPLVVMFAPICVVPPLLVVKLVSATVPPTAPPNVVVPVVLTVRSNPAPARYPPYC